MNWLYEIAAWFRGWRYDLDGFLVRALKPDDPDLTEMNLVHVGFCEEAAIAVRSAALAWAVDTGQFGRPTVAEMRDGEW